MRLTEEQKRNLYWLVCALLVIFTMAALSSCNSQRYYQSEALLQQEYERAVTLHKQGLMEVRVYDQRCRMMRIEIIPER
jgi:hypothetical protein